MIAIEKLKEEENGKYYVMLSFVVTFLCFNLEMTLVHFGMLLLTSIIYLLYKKQKGFPEIYDAVPLVALMPSIFLSKVFIWDSINFNFAIIVSFIFIAITTMCSLIKKNANIYTITSLIYIIGSIIAFQLNHYLSIVLVLIWAILHTFLHEQKNVYKVIAYVAGLLLYNTIIFDLHLTNITLIKLLGYMACIYLISRTVIQKVDGPYEGIESVAMAALFIYAICSYTSVLDALIFLVVLLVAAIGGWGTKTKALYGISLVAIAILINRVLLDVHFASTTLVSLIGYLCVLYLITRTIFKKADYSYKAIEYIGTSIIYLYALFNYTGLVDAMIFIGFMVLLVVYSYIRKIGPLFLTSLIAIVMNILKLTKDFWVSIPWWVYMCVVGATLLTFAIRNEAKNKNFLKEAIQKLKDDVDL